MTDILKVRKTDLMPISHYSEMLEQCPVKVAVIKQNSGRSKIEVKEG